MDYNFKTIVQKKKKGSIFVIDGQSLVQELEQLFLIKDNNLLLFELNI